MAAKSKYQTCFRGAGGKSKILDAQRSRRVLEVWQWIGGALCRGFDGGSGSKDKVSDVFWVTAGKLEVSILVWGAWQRHQNIQGVLEDWQRS